ncbi:MAG: 5-carboxymethyl-2-hydroxymuconate semialdehyde dehydrogenase [Saprospiraceae bacterium]|nr:5-carboxymethyl-2-hydroxymuconate semialdehyde dehydrogenase [Bacteroidia bacterium]NNL93346.1 5-carboxymethyl-2-hydroxymuconate semialdehyde dehydrogenase [Saprospiraceae bacterium]
MLAKNEKKLRSELRKLKKSGIKNIINGKEINSASKKTFENFSPVDGKKIGDVAYGIDKDIDKAAKAAATAFKTWRNVPHKERKKILHAIADNIEKYAEEIAVCESYDTGQPIRFTKKAAIRGAANFRFFADKVIDAANGLSTPDTHHVNFTMKQPIGPVGIITPWNAPFMLSTWKIAPALAAGCTVVHKPAELSPVTANILARAAHEAGLPKGVWNVVHGFGETAGKALTEHDDIKAIAFVGETTTGSHIMRQGAQTLKRVHFELGGKNPVFVFDDADMERALDAVIFMKYSLNGERCTSSSRLLLHDKVYDKFIAKLKKRVSKIKVGNPLDPKTEIGPLIHASHQEKVLSYAKLAKEEGAKVLVGGNKPRNLKNGCYVNPILVDGVTTDMRVANEEVFGPFLSVLKFKNEAEAVKIANSVRYGLTAYIWTKDVERAHRIARDVDAGMVWVNSQNVRHLPTPFGGVKYSGIGRDGGEYSFEFYMETKNISVAYGTHAIPKLGVGN